MQKLAIPLNANQVIDSAFADAQLKHHQVSYDNITDSLPAPVLKLIQMVKEGEFADLPALDKIREELGIYRNYFISEDTQLTTTIRNELSHLKTQVTNLQRQTQEKQQQINQKTNESKSLQNQIQQKNQELNQVRQNNQRLQKDLDEQRRKNQTLDKQLAHAREQQKVPDAEDAENPKGLEKDQQINALS